MQNSARLRARVLSVLRSSSVFGKLDESVLQDLAGVLSMRAVRGGETVLHEGDDASSMLFVITGAMRVSHQDPSGKLILFNEIRPGACFGEVGMILQQPRAADVSALRDSTVAVLSSKDYAELLARHPLALNRVFVQAIYNHLRHNSPTDPRHAESVVVVPLQKDADAIEVARELTKAFAKLGPSHCISLENHVGFGHADADKYTEATAQQDVLDEEFEYLVYEAGRGASDWTQRAFRLADQVVFVGSAGSSQDIGLLERQLMKEPGYPVKRHHLVVLYPDSAVQPTGVSSWRRGRDLERIYPIRRSHREDYERLARFLAGRAIGLVLGGGGARGFAHLGVLKALQEVGKPVDLIGGNSMGALIGAQYVCDVPLDEIRVRTQKFAVGGERPTLPLVSLMSGNRVRRDLMRMFGDIQADGLWRPYFAATCNLTKGCTTVQETGPLWRAVLASNSPAGLFPPVLVQGELLVDGAILENVPVAAMRMRLGMANERRRGNGTLIAVDVDVQEDFSAPQDLSKLSIWNAIAGFTLPKAKRSPSIAQIMYRAGHIGGLNLRGQTKAESDHYLEPPVSHFPLMGYRSSAEIAEVGYRYTMEQMSHWKW
jgi:NTE family protein/lysophospholipid hydrolase